MKILKYISLLCLATMVSIGLIAANSNAALAHEAAAHDEVVTYPVAHQMEGLESLLAEDAPTED